MQGAISWSRCRASGARRAVSLAHALARSTHLRAVRALATTVARSRPGSYAWPRLRREAEDCFARGDAIIATIARLRGQHARDHAKVPSIRTMQRWFAQCRWLNTPAAIVAHASEC
jgi:hypothetical protein